MNNQKKISKAEVKNLVDALDDLIDRLNDYNHNSSFENPSNLDKATSLIQESIDWIKEEEGGI
tara:strand:+ start:999 stop:1187 length:189 start_codon:yes stop_codon:yes gene_type:complete